MLKRLIHILCFYIFFINSSYASQLEIYLFKVGQANFNILKTDTKAWVIDCGTKRKTERVGTVYVQQQMKSQINSILQNIKPIILISHMDDDHYCALSDFFPKEKRTRVIIGGIPSEQKKLPKVFKDNDIYFVENKLDGAILDSSLKNTGTKFTI